MLCLLLKTIFFENKCQESSDPRPFLDDVISKKIRKKFLFRFFISSFSRTDILCAEVFCFYYQVKKIVFWVFLFQTRFTVPRTWVLLQLSIGLFANFVTMNVYPTVAYITANCNMICGKRLLSYLARKLAKDSNDSFPLFHLSVNILCFSWFYNKSVFARTQLDR